MSTDNEDRNESYYLDYVRQYLNRPNFFISGLDLKVFSKMGDRLAAAILQTIDTEQSPDDASLQKIVAAVRSSLAYPSAITYDDDRAPTATLCLLRRLMANAKTAEQQEIIRYTIKTIDRFCNPPTKSTSE